MALIRKACFLCDLADCEPGMAQLFAGCANVSETHKLAESAAMMPAKGASQRDRVDSGFLRQVAKRRLVNFTFSRKVVGNTFQPGGRFVPGSVAS